ncbi:MAG: putative RDD family membrane protein YckC [Pirellulaceae bacterium]|jgi:uncharacterized RDD family membrane protein YckC
MARKTVQLDSTIQIVTPENIAFNYRVAGPFRRFPAFLIDVILRIGIFCAAAFLIMLLISAVTGVAGGIGASLTAGIGVAILMVLYFIFDQFYGGLFECLMNGQTPGKWVMGIRVVTKIGEPINGLQAIMRNIFRWIDLFPMLSIEVFGSEQPAYIIPTFLFGLVCMTLTKRYQRIGDLVCGTMVIVEERHWLTGIAKLEDARTSQLASFIPTDYVVSRSLARALSSYVDRRRFFTTARRREVARYLAEPLLREFQLPTDTSHDLLLCALYYRCFIADRTDEGELTPANMTQPGIGNPQANSADNPVIIRH